MQHYKETKSNKLYTLFARMFGLRYEVASKKYRKEIDQYFYTNNSNNASYITSVKTFKLKDKTIIAIETHRPGLLIGKAGVFIDGLKKYLNKNLEENIVIDLSENKLWFKLY